MHFRTYSNLLKHIRQYCSMIEKKIDYPFITYWYQSSDRFKTLWIISFHIESDNLLSISSQIIDNHNEMIRNFHDNPYDTYEIEYDFIRVNNSTGFYEKSHNITTYDIKQFFNNT